MKVKVRFPQVESTDSVAWAEAVTYVTVDSVEVARYGMDRSGNYYYQTVNGHVYLKQPNGWVKII
jgi:hypothetical protein